MTRLPPGWVLTTIGDTCEVIQGQSPPGSSYNTTGIGLPFFQGKAEFGDLYPSVRKWTTDPKKIADKDDVLLSIRAPVGPTNLAPMRCVVGRGLAAIRPRADIAARFVLYWLRSSEAVLAVGATGSTFEAVSGSQVREHQFPLPPLKEQRRIVAAIEEHLSRLDAADASLIAVARRTSGLVAARLSEATDGYPAVELGTVTTSHRYGTSVKCTTNPGEVAVLRIPNVRDGKVDTSDLKFATSRELGDCFVEQGDLLIIRTNGSRALIGRAAVVDGAAGMAFASYLIRVRPTTDLDPAWCVIVLSSPSLRAEIEARAASTAGQYNLNLASLRSLPIPLPPLNEQRRIVAQIEEQLSSVDVLRAALERAQRRSRSLRRAILERAFRGELVPQDPSEEPASVVLERIRAERKGAPRRTSGHPNSSARFGLDRDYANGA